MIMDGIVIDIKTQILVLYAKGQKIANYPISTAIKGVGEENGSYMTPRGKHMIRAKIGVNLPEGAVLVGRRFTGEIYTDELAEKLPQRDWILSRILWLSGTQPGVNRLGTVDTMQRYIYIHGCPDSVPMGKPHSKGCIRMRNKDVISLFDQVPLSTQVVIIEDSTQLDTLPVIRELSTLQLSYLWQNNPTLKCYTMDMSTSTLQAYFYLAWDQWGKRIAFARLCAEGIVDNFCMQDIHIMKYLMAEIIRRAKKLGWFEIRAMVKIENVSIFQDCQFMPIGDIFERNGQHYQQCRIFIPT